MEEEKQVLKKQVRDNVEGEKTKMDKKAELLVLERRLQMERVEREMEEKLEKERLEALVMREKQENEEKLASEMSRVKREQARDQKLREQLKESNADLKALESKLRAAYVTKQLTAQIAEKKATVAQEKLEKIKIQEMIEAERRCLDEQVRERDRSLLAEKLKYKEDLLAQIGEGNKKKKDAQRDLMLEKALLETSMKKLREEEENEKASHSEKLKMVKQEIEEFQRQKEIHKQREKVKKEEEESRIKAYAVEKEKLEEQRIRDLKEKNAIKNNLKDKITLSHLSKRQSMSEREEVLMELAEEEIRQRDFRKDKEKAEAAEKTKDEFIKFYNKHLEEKQIALKRDFDEQERYRRQMMEAIAKQEEIDGSLSSNKGARSKELREILQHQMKEKHIRQIQEWQRESALKKLLELEDNERMKIVNEERIRMLKTHAASLVGYLPRGVLKEDDLNHLGHELLDKLHKQNEMNLK